MVDGQELLYCIVGCMASISRDSGHRAQLYSGFTSFVSTRSFDTAASQVSKKLAISVNCISFDFRLACPLADSTSGQWQSDSRCRSFGFDDRDHSTSRDYPSSHFRSLASFHIRRMICEDYLRSWTSLNLQDSFGTNQILDRGQSESFLALQGQRGR